MGLFDAFNAVSHQEWMAKIKEDLKGKDFQETLVWNSDQGIAVQPFYHGDTVTPLAIPTKKSKGWKIRENIFITTILSANNNALAALAGGANSIAFIGEIKNQQEMDALLKGIQSEIIDLHFYHHQPNSIAKFITPTAGSISFNYLDHYASTNNWIESQELDLTALAELTNSTPTIQTIRVGSGASNTPIANQLAYAISQGVEYLHQLSERGLAVEKIANKMQFNFSIGSNYFFEIAKLRAARLLWNTILEEFKVNEVSMFIHSTTSISVDSEEDENYELLRNTSKAMSAIFGGCDSLTVLPHQNSEETHSFSHRIARNIQHILKEEAFLDQVNNPADGAYYLEEITQQMAKNAWLIFQKIEANGGFLASVENNFFKST